MMDWHLCAHPSRQRQRPRVPLIMARWWTQQREEFLGGPHGGHTGTVAGGGDREWSASGCPRAPRSAFGWHCSSFGGLDSRSRARAAPGRVARWGSHDSTHSGTRVSSRRAAGGVSKVTKRRQKYKVYADRSLAHTGSGWALPPPLSASDSVEARCRSFEDRNKGSPASARGPCAKRKTVNARK